MVEPTVTLVIERTGTDLTISGDDSQPLSLVTYQAPAKIARTQYAGTSPWLEGNTPTSSVDDLTGHAMQIRAEGATEAALQATVAELEAAVGQFVFTVTTTINGGVKVWGCHKGSVLPVERDYADLRRFVAFYNVTIPCQPRST